ncbi:MAG: DNA polymerase, partial [Syntrophales bacterium]|nr:DNA polymerase [Syntrophales bacterium]
GMGPFGLSKELGISQTLAKEYIEKYFEEFRGVREYMDTLLEKARRDGFVATLFNRRRYLPEIRSANAPVRSFAERTAINTPIQGTAADLIKVAMIRIAAGLQARGMRTGMIMQVHDELVFETPMEERDEAVVLVREGMEKVLELEVPLKVEIAEGANWDEAH